jgi:hypothetical protein
MLKLRILVTGATRTMRIAEPCEMLAERRQALVNWV